MSKTRPPYPAAFRQQMVELVRSGRTPGLGSGVRALGPGDANLGRAFAVGPPPPFRGYDIRV